MTITQRLSSDGELRKLSVISTLDLENFLCDSIRQDLRKLAAGIFPPRSLTPQYDWLTKITWDMTHAIPRVGEKTFEYFKCCLKISPQKSAEKLFVSLVCLLRSFSKDLSAGKRCFVEVAVNCVSAL